MRQGKEVKGVTRIDEGSVSGAPAATVGVEEEVHSVMPRLVHALGISWLDHWGIWMTKQREHE